MHRLIAFYTQQCMFFGHILAQCTSTILVHLRKYDNCQTNKYRWMIIMSTSVGRGGCQYMARRLGGKKKTKQKTRIPCKQLGVVQIRVPRCTLVSWGIWGKQSEPESETRKVTTAAARTSTCLHSCWERKKEITRIHIQIVQLSSIILRI